MFSVPPRNRDVDLSGPDQLGRHVDRLQARGALAIDGNARDLFWNSGPQRGQARGVSRLSGLKSVAEYHLVHHVQLQVGPFQGRTDGGRSQVRRGKVLERSAELSYGCASSADDHSLVHTIPPHREVHALNLEASIPSSPVPRKPRLSDVR